MPRNARQISKTGVYHIMLRGNEQRDIFGDDADKVAFLDFLYNKKVEEGCLMYAYCLMDNHVHLVVKEGVNGIAKFMRRIGTSYVKYYNQRYNRIGHLFQDRYKSENVETDGYLLTVIRYVHQNPEKAGICKSEEYRWSSYPAYLGGPRGTGYGPEMAEVLGMFSQKTAEALMRFRQFHDEHSKEVCLDIVDHQMEAAAVQQHIHDILKNTGMTIQDLGKAEHLPVLKEVILGIVKSSKLSGRKISQVTGINRETIRKALLMIGKV